MPNKFADWPEEYARKLRTPAEAAGLVQPGDAIVIPVGALTPTIAAAIFARGEELREIHVYEMAPAFDPGWFNPGHPAFLMHVEVFSTVVSREALARGRADFTSISFGQRFKTEDERSRPVHHADIVLISVSPPDHLGFCSFGLNIWNSRAFAERARLVFAEVHSSLVRTGGDGRIHVSEIDAFVEAGPLPSGLTSGLRLDCPPEIAGFIAQLVNDGDTIQVGTGSLTNGLPLGGAFAGKEDLGVHAELSVPGMTGLVRQGVITGARKTVNRGKYVAAQLEASQPGDIEFIQDNPVFELRDVGYVNDIRVIASHDNMVAINNALAIDFTGQITAESIGGELWSGPGGQQDFAIGALLSKGGRNVTVLRSVAVSGSVSRIVPTLPEGTVITVPRQYADYVVTEWGIAQLLGRSDRERAEELISVAHPDHRAGLRQALAKFK